MQDYKSLLYNFKAVLASRMSGEQEIIHRLVAITGKDYKSVWRRLRGEYKFSLEEIFNICTELGISMESLGSVNPASVGLLQVYQFPDPFSLRKNYISNLFTILEDAANCPDSSYTVICNRLPESLHIKYDRISQLLLLKLEYFTKKTVEADSFQKLIDGWPAFEHLKNRYLNLIDRFNSLTLLWGTNIFENVVRDVHFFLDVDMITAGHVLQIKEELRSMIGYISDLCSDPIPYEKFTFAVSPVDMNFHSNTISSATVNRTDFFSLPSCFLRH